MLTHVPSCLGDFLGPLFRRPKRLQMAALCHRTKRAGPGFGPPANAAPCADKEYLLVTSRDTGRWIIPKGWPIRGLKSNETALREAWEEAGVKNSKASDQPIGTYTYQKRRENGFAFPVETLVYSVAVSEMSDDFPEAHERTRTWVSAQAAANMVQEDELKAIFRDQ